MTHSHYESSVDAGYYLEFSFNDCFYSDPTQAFFTDAYPPPPKPGETKKDENASDAKAEEKPVNEKPADRKPDELPIQPIGSSCIFARMKRTN